MTVHLLSLHNTPIVEQLQIEEALLRADTRNWCLINRGSPPAIVLGISGKAERLINFNKLAESPIPVVRRFSGGGTVVVDDGTLFVTLLFNQDSIAVEPYPLPIMQWTEKLYHPVFQQEDFRLRENDYTFGDHKFGGNAQYIRKGRWLHHSTLLWDYSEKRMEYLTIPEKKPSYRGERGHNNFLCRMKKRIDSRDQMLDRLVEELDRRFGVLEENINTVEQVLLQPYRKSTVVLDTTLDSVC